MSSCAVTRDAIAKMLEALGRSNLKDPILGRPNQNEIGFPIYRCIGCGDRQMQANSRSLVCESSLSNTS
jgi:hypothetical protein